MRRILLSIKPEYTEKIFSGEKKFEFRKNRCKSDVKKIIVYCTTPVMRVVGEADIAEVIEETPASVWEKTKSKAGISKEYYDSYFAGRATAVAYRLENVTRYATPRTLASYGVSAPPQSYMYLYE